MDQETAPVDPSDLVSLVPAPDWAVHEPYLSDMAESGDAFVQNGICQLLTDTQVNLAGPELAWHYRNAQRVLTRTGAERAAHFMVEFEPAWQRLDVHFIRIVRGEERIEHARPGAIQTFRRETNLERLVLDGRMTASLLIPDVRIDDIIEVSITIHGGNPVLKGKFSAWVTFNAFAPWRDCRHRVLRPSERSVTVKPVNDPPAALTETCDGLEDSRWRLAQQNRRQAEALTPPWQILVPALQFSEFSSWNEVARLFTPFYDSADLPETLAAEIDRLAGQHVEADQRAAEWLHFVQQRLRYFALSLGEGGLVPRNVESIWSCRFGDCKDASRLFIAGARQLGLDVCAALVSTTHGPILDQVLPGPSLFNHCIVRLSLNGKHYWLDPTLQSQAGSLDNIFFPHTGWALPLSHDTERLEKLPSETAVRYVNCEEVVSLGPKRDSPAKLHRRVEYISSVADMTRNRIANQGVAEYSKAVLKDLQAIWPEIKETAPITVSDDPAANRCTVSSSYEIAGCWKPSAKADRLEFKLVDLVIASELKQISGTQRTTDLYLGRPRKIMHKVRMEMPRSWSGNGWDRTAKAPGIDFFDQLTIYDRNIVVAKALEIGAWTMPASRAGDYRQLMEKIHQNTITIWAQERFGKIVPNTGGRREFQMIWVIIWIFIVIVTILAQIGTGTH